MDVIGEALSAQKHYKERLHLALHAAQICVFEVDVPGQRYTFFENAEAIYGKTGAQILRELEPFSRLSPEEYQKSVSDYFTHPGDHAIVDQAFRSIFAGQNASYVARMRAGDTRYTWCKVDVTPILEGGVPVRMIGVVSNLDKMIQQSQRYRRESEHDPLTGLLNRQGIRCRLNALLNQEPDMPRLLLIGDLDNLKTVNDRYGHLQGDRALMAFAQALVAVFPQADLVGRWGGDEFILLLPRPAEIDRLPNQLRSLLTGASDPAVTGSFGGACFPDHAQNWEDLFRLADRALYAAKEKKPAFVLYQPEAD